MKITDKFLDNARWAAVAKIVSGALAFALVFLLGRVLKATNYGLFATTLSILTFARIVGGSGLGQSTGKHLANLKGEGVEIKTGQYLAAGFLAQTAGASILSILLWLGSGRLAAYFHNPDLTPLLKLGAVVIIFLSLTEFSKSCLQGLQRFDYLTLVTGVEFVGKLLFAVGLAWLGYGVAGVLNGYALALALATLVAAAVFLRSGMAWPHLDRREWRSLVSYSIPLIFTGAGFIIYTELDNVMIFYYMGAKAAGIYSIAINMARAIPFIASPIGLAAAPVVVKLYHRQEGGAADFVSRLIKYVVAGFFPAAVALYVFAPQVLGLVREEYVAGAPALRVMSVFVLSLSMATVTVPMLDYLGKARTRAVWMIVSVSANVLLNFLLIPTFGAVGAAFATAATHTPYTLNNVSVLARTVGLKPQSVLLDIARIFAASAAAGIAAALALVWLHSIVLALLVGAFLYAGLLLSTGIFSFAEIGKLVEKILTGIKPPISGETLPGDVD